MPAKVIKDSSIKIAESIKQWTLNYTDIEDNSNKCYNLEVIKDTKGDYYLYSNYGRVGGTLAREFRPCNSQFEAEKDGEKIVKSKLKKGYVEVKLAKADIGSDKAKEKVFIQAVSEDQAKKLGFEIKDENKSSLHPKIQELMKSWFGSLENFVTSNLDTKKCSLGQLSLEQINKGRDLLLEARSIVRSGAKDFSELNRITSKYYSNIPMNFGYRRLDADTLRFDNDDKLDKAFDLLDTLEGAKDAEKVLYKKNAYDDQYKSLKSEIEYVEPNTQLWNWVNSLLVKTKASNHHHLNKVKSLNIYKLERTKEEKTFLEHAHDYAKNNIHKRKELPDFYKPLWKDRFKYDADYEGLMEAANILPLWHGTRTENMPKIVGSRLLMPRPGFTISGAMFGPGLYFANSSTKSCGYTSFSGSIWSGGNSNSGYMFLTDVILGKCEIAHSSYQYRRKNISPAISVWAKAGRSLYNDEHIVYTEEQAWLRYIVEFTA